METHKGHNPPNRVHPVKLLNARDCWEEKLSGDVNVDAAFRGFPRSGMRLAGWRWRECHHERCHEVSIGSRYDGPVSKIKTFWYQRQPIKPGVQVNMIGMHQILCTSTAILSTIV